MCVLSIIKAFDFLSRVFLPGNVAHCMCRYRLVLFKSVCGNELRELAQGNAETLAVIAVSKKTFVSEPGV